MSPSEKDLMLFAAKHYGVSTDRIRMEYKVRHHETDGKIPLFYALSVGSYSDIEVNEPHGALTVRLFRDTALTNQVTGFTFLSTNLSVFLSIRLGGVIVNRNECTFHSSSPSVAEINSNGTITTRSHGVTTITVTRISDGVSGSVNLGVSHWTNCHIREVSLGGQRLVGFSRQSFGHFAGHRSVWLHSRLNIFIDELHFNSFRGLKVHLTGYEFTLI